MSDNKEETKIKIIKWIYVYNILNLISFRINILARPHRLKYSCGGPNIVIER